MGKKDLNKILQDIGLSENEAKVYLASISLGPASVIKISNLSGLKRTNVYPIIESLKQKGLIKIEFIGFKKTHVPEDPKVLKQVLKRKEEEFNNLLPEFEAIYNLKDSNSNIKYYEGLESIKNALELILSDTRPNEEYLVIADQENWYNQDPKFFENFMNKKAKKDLKIRMLLKDSQLTRKHKKFEKNYNINIKILPKETQINTDLCITNKHVMIQQIKQPVTALMIDNSSIIETHKEMFEIIWKNLT